MKRMAWITRTAFGIFIAFGCAIASAQSTARVSGTIAGVDPTGDSVRISFSCIGAPTCNGTYTFTFKDPACSNTLSFNDTFVLAGLDLSRSGNLSGTLMGNTDFYYMRNSNGTCTFTTINSPFSLPYTGTWNGTSGTLTTLGFLNGTFTASGLPSAAPPVFPMTVTGTITPTVANISASIQPRAQDVGTRQSVYVFAHVPASTLRKVEAKQVPPGPITFFEPEDDDFCVLAQINASGQLTGVSASTMQAFTTTVLTAQGQAVTVLNNVSTPSISGATFYVGYGTTASTMLTGGVYQNAVSVPGASQCNASLSSAPLANSPGGLSGLWYNAAESGWGVHFTQRRNIVFAAWYTYDAAGAPKWYVASSCALPTGTTGTTGTCSGTLYEVSGPVFFGATFNPALVNVRTAGTLQVNFANANSATMTYTANGQTRTVGIARQVFQTGTTTPAVDYTDLWYNASESGWGMAISHQYGVMFLAWYVYDSTGKPVWYVASNCVVSGSSCAGTLYRTTGPPLGPTFNPSQVQVFTAGTMSVTFTDANNGVLTYTVNGVTSTKAITRQVF